MCGWILFSASLYLLPNRHYLPFVTQSNRNVTVAQEVNFQFMNLFKWVISVVVPPLAPCLSFANCHCCIAMAVCCSCCCCFGRLSPLRLACPFAPAVCRVYCVQMWKLLCVDYYDFSCRLHFYFQLHLRPHAHRRFSASARQLQLWSTHFSTYCTVLHICMSVCL